ncbi:MAG: Maf family nucleotide pyrophosphatase [Betaproteobacteria bacterium]|nr:Maf family nucleotide pyrophosphatase [Betaproteobacteria bacterium]
MTSPQLVLASTSAYRRALLERLGLGFEVAAPGVDETPLPREAPERTALRLAEAKARAVTIRHPAALIIGSDQLAVLGGEALGKPGTHAAAVEQLRRIRGREVVFHTALCLFDAASGEVQLDNVPTTVVLRKLTDAQIERYLALERPYDCAGSARIEGLGIALVERVASEDPSALIGLPLIALTTMLKNRGVEIV